MCFTKICSANKVAFNGRRNEDKHLVQEYHYDKGTYIKIQSNTLRFYCLCWERTMMDGFFQVQEASLCPEMQKAAPQPTTCHDMSTGNSEEMKIHLGYDLFIPYLSAFGFRIIMMIRIYFVLFWIYILYSEGLVLYTSSKWMTLEQNMTFPLQAWKILWHLRFVK